MKVSEPITNKGRKIAMEHNEIAAYLETKTLRPTNTKGFRIKATWPMYYNPPISLVIAYDHALTNRNYTIDYYTLLTALALDTDTLIVPDHVMAQFYLKWKYLVKLASGKESEESKDNRDEFKARLKKRVQIS